MPDLASLTDMYPQQDQSLPVQQPYRGVNLGPLQVPTDGPIGNTATIVPAAPAPDVVQALPDVGNGVLEQPFSTGTTVGNRLTGLGGEERYQTWPERMIREGLSAPGDVLARTEPSTSESLIEPAMQTAALAGTGGLAGVEEGAGTALGSTPFLRPALKYGDKIYKAPINGQHLDALPAHLTDTFQQQAMNGEDISNFNFGFMNHKGQFLDREKALDYAVKEGLVDPSAGKYGALTSTLLSDSSKPGVAIESMKQPFYSAVEHQVNQVQQPKMTGEQWLGTLSNKPGVKPEEMQWTGLQDFLKDKGKEPVTKQEVQEHLANNKVELKEVDKGGAGIHPDEALKAIANGEDVYYKAPRNGQQQGPIDADDVAAMRNEPGFTFHKGEEAETKYDSYQLPGATNYREKLLTLPEKPNLNADGLPHDYHLTDENAEAAKLGFKIPEGTPQRWSYKGPSISSRIFKSREEAVADALSNAKREEHTGAYKSSHWDEPNILAHVRMNDRMIDGKKSLHLEEIQSDWHQQGRDKGYKNPEKAAKAKAIMEEMAAIEKAKGGLAGGMKDSRWKELDKELDSHQNDDLGVPDAPFKKTWHELALKRMIREAAEKGYDRLSWTPGEAQAARYDLSKSIGSLKATPIMDQSGLKYEIRATNPAGTSEVLNQVHTAEELPNIVGKEMAKKIIDDTEGKHPKTFKGLDLKIGGEGMKGFYDQIIPKALEKISGEKVKTAQVVTHKGFAQKLSVYDKEGHHVKDFNNMTDARAYLGNPSNGLPGGTIKGNKEVSPKTDPVHYIDIPQSLKDKAMNKGFPLFSGGYMFTPVSHNPFQQKDK